MLVLSLSKNRLAGQANGGENLINRMRFPIVMQTTLSASKNTYPCVFQKAKVEKLVKFHTLDFRVVFLSMLETL